MKVKGMKKLYLASAKRKVDKLSLSSRDIISEKPQKARIGQSIAPKTFRLLFLSSSAAKNLIKAVDKCNIRIGVIKPTVTPTCAHTP